MQIYILIILVVVHILFLNTSQAFAARNISIESASKTALFGDEEVTLNASPSGFTDGETIYIKGAFYQEGGATNNYFGFTRNGDNWIKNGDPNANQRQVKIGEWNGNVIVKADFADSGYKGEGGYKLRLGFYYITSTGNISSSVSWSTNSVDLNLSEPDPTPTDTPTKEPTPTKTPTPIPFKTPTPTPSTKPTVTKTITKSATKSANLSGIPTSVLGANTKTDDKKTQDDKSAKVLGAAADSRNNFRIIILALGIILLACAILVFLRSRTKNLE
jgi:hypothetical protein